MSRLIDADEFKRINKRLLHCDFPYLSELTLEELLDEIPTVDAVPVSTLEQIKWERDSFAEQIREIGGEPFAKWDAMDVVKVVRRKDCRYWNKDTITHNENDFRKWNSADCDLFQYRDGCHDCDWSTEEDDFCSYGEKVTE